MMKCGRMFPLTLRTVAVSSLAATSDVPPSSANHRVHAIYTLGQKKKRAVIHHFPPNGMCNEITAALCTQCFFSAPLK